MPGKGIAGAIMRAIIALIAMAFSGNCVVPPTLNFMGHSAPASKSSKESIMAGLNQVTLIGNLGKDPVLRETATGTSVANMDIATSEVRTNPDGSTVSHTEWHKIVAWNKSAENSAKFLRKGNKVAITGVLRTRSWDDNNGVRRYVTEIHAKSVEFLDKIVNVKNRRPDAPPQDEEYTESENPAPKEAQEVQAEVKPATKKKAAKKKATTKKKVAKK